METKMTEPLDRRAADPIFAAIARHRAADAALGAASMRADDIAAKEEGREVTDADRAAHEAALAEDDAALEALLATDPTTLGGLRALVAHFVKTEGDLASDDPSYRCLETLLRSPLLATGVA